MTLYHKDHHIWISASAGTGKTKSLSDRYLSLLLQNVDHKKILCLTFTNAAAAEMSTRIQNRLSHWCLCSDDTLYHELKGLAPEGEVKHWMQKARHLFFDVIDQFESLRIQTIHSFAQSLTTAFSCEAGVPAYFGLVDDTLKKVLLSRSREQVLASKNPLHITSWTRLFEEMAPATLYELLDHILSDRFVFRSRFSNAFEEEKELRTFLNLPMEGTCSEWLSDFHTRTTHEQASLEKIVGALMTHGSKTDQEKAEVLRACLKNPLMLSEWWSQYQTLFLTDKGSIRSALATKKVQERDPIAFEYMVREAEQVREMREREKGWRIFETSRALRTIVEGVSSCYEEAKAEHAVLDFDDLIFKAFKLLSNPDHKAWIQYRMDQKIDHILVDEAQDTNAYQWKILQALTEDFFCPSLDDVRERSLFVVGDEKQSIYSFQGANAAIFKYMKQYFRTQTLEPLKWKDHTLTVSYRSSSAILSVVDDVFNRFHLLKETLEDPTNVEHQSFYHQRYGRVSLWPLLRTRDDAEKKDNEEGSLKTELAHHIASTIRQWLDEGRTLCNQGRRIQPSDILILVQKRDDFFFAVIHTLRRMGIPVSGADRVVLNDQLVFKDLMALGRFLLNPEDDFSLALTLKSPLFGLEASLLEELLLSRGERSLFASLRQGAKADQLKTILDDLMALLQKVDLMTPYQLYAHILYEKEGLGKLLGRLGHESYEFIQEFLGLALSFDQKNGASLEHFMDGLSRDRFVLKRDYGQEMADEVRVMTVHGSKGLESPIVFIADASRRETDLSDHCWCETPKGDLLIFKRSKDDQPEVLSDYLASTAHLDPREYFRKLYVALTRAEEELYITGWAPTHGNADETWYGYLLSTMQALKTEVGTHEALRMGLDPDCDLSYHVIKGTGVPLGEEKLMTMQTLKEPSLPSWLSKSTSVDHPPSTHIPSEHSLSDHTSSEHTVHNEASPPSEHSSYATQRGIFIHKLFEELPSLPREDHQNLIDTYLNAGLFDASLHKEAGEILRRVYRVMHHPEWSEFFGPYAYAEVSLYDRVMNQTYRVDRLLIKNQDVKLIDFKTGGITCNDGAPEVSEAYRVQLDRYKDLLKRLYPKHSVRSYILWVDHFDVIEV